MLTMIIFLFVASFSIFAVGGIFLATSKHSKKANKHLTEVFTELFDDDSQPLTNEPMDETPTQEEEIYCEFCGSRLDKKDKRCSQCGAARKK